MLHLVNRVCAQNELKIFYWPQATVIWWEACYCVSISSNTGEFATYWTTHGYKREPKTIEEKLHNKYIELRIIQEIRKHFVMKRRALRKEFKK